MEKNETSSRIRRVISSRTGQPLYCTAIEIVTTDKNGNKMISEIRQFPEELITALPTSSRTYPSPASP